MNFVKPIKELVKIEEMKNYLMHQSYRDYFLFEFGINTGVLIGDILPLKVTDVQNTDYIKIQKKGQEAQFLINDELKSEIRKYIVTLNNQDYLFPSRNGGHLSIPRAHVILSRAAKAVGLNGASGHTLRKTFGYHHYMRFKDANYLKRLFNHPTILYTLRYIDVDPVEVERELRGFNL